ncbi:hypothetical protein H4217_007019 [Coemansia sp. RSA 1939]|nr:hypothetical protein H4217_007019 [Coemansia sp. RSA 1939]KAJ2594708.1 hypothetical protein EV177_008304 [Coemansia sp. RSA 1804]KAJ2689032.1 hypothetical protein GGH99_002909 [Coemansia sp. RSA 1285]
MSASKDLPIQGKQYGRWVVVTAAVVVAVAATTGTALYLGARYLKADHEKTMSIRNAKLRYRSLLAELSECKGIIDYMDKESIPRARQLSEKACALIEQYKGDENEPDADSLKEIQQQIEPIERELVGINEQILRLMERIDGVAPAHVLDAAKLDPWTELDPKLKERVVNKGLGTVLELAGDIRAIRKGLVQKAERRAKTVDALKSKIKL